MFSFGGTELLIVALVALLLFGPEKLPQLAKTIGRFTREFNKYKDILESTVQNEIYRSERQDEQAKLDQAKAKGEAAAAAAAASVGVVDADPVEIPETSEVSPDGAPEAVPAVVAADPAAEPLPVTDAPVQPPAAVAATSEDEDEEDEG